MGRISDHEKFQITNFVELVQKRDNGWLKHLDDSSLATLLEAAQEEHTAREELRSKKINSVKELIQSTISLNCERHEFNFYNSSFSSTYIRDDKSDISHTAVEEIKKEIDTCSIYNFENAYWYISYKECSCGHGTYKECSHKCGNITFTVTKSTTITNL